MHKNKSNKFLVISIRSAIAILSIQCFKFFYILLCFTNFKTAIFNRIEIVYYFLKSLLLQLYYSSLKIMKLTFYNEREKYSNMHTFVNSCSSIIITNVFISGANKIRVIGRSVSLKTVNSFFVAFTCFSITGVNRICA